MTSTLTQILLSTLLDTPCKVEMKLEIKEKAISIIKQYFTFTTYEITKAYQEAYAYALAAISVGLAVPTREWVLPEGLDAKITHDFAKQIEAHYFQSFTHQYFDNEIRQDELIAQFRKKNIEILKKFAIDKDKLLPIEPFTNAHLITLVNYQGPLTISDCVLEQMRSIAPLEKSLAAFLCHNELIGHTILFFFRKIIQQDKRLEETQAVLQRAGLCLEVSDLQTAIKQAQENLNHAIQKKSPHLSQIAQQLEHLIQAERVWKTRSEPLIHFSNLFKNDLKEGLDWAKKVFCMLEEKDRDHFEDHNILIEEILQQVITLMTRYHLSAQIKPHDEFIQYNTTSQQLIQHLASQWEQLPSHHPKYSWLSILLSSLLASIGQLEYAEYCLIRTLGNTHDETEKALAYFNLFQVQWRKAYVQTQSSIKEQLYAQALIALQKAIAINPERYALHDRYKGYYPIERLLGAGSMGCVLLCRNHNPLIKKERVVIKCFWETPQDLMNKDSINPVFKEAIAMYDLAPDYVPEPLDFNCIPHQHAYFVTEYLDDAINAKTWLEKKGPMDLETGLLVSLQIAKSLQLAHDAGIYHLDLKLENILLKQTNTEISVKITDFGLARVIPSLRRVVASLTQTQLTLFGQILFSTLDYVPPEQQDLTQYYDKPSITADIFAFGILIYRLLTGKKHFSEQQLPNVPTLRQLLSHCIEAFTKTSFCKASTHSSHGN